METPVVRPISNNFHAISIATRRTNLKHISLNFWMCNSVGAIFVWKLDSFKGAQRKMFHDLSGGKNRQSICPKIVLFKSTKDLVPRTKWTLDVFCRRSWPKDYSSPWLHDAHFKGVIINISLEISFRVKNCEKYFLIKAIQYNPAKMLADFYHYASIDNLDSEERLQSLVLLDGQRNRAFWLPISDLDSNAAL